MGLPYFQINGGTRLRGKARIGGAKNAALPIMAATLLCEGEVILHDVPRVSDVRFRGSVVPGQRVVMCGKMLEIRPRRCVGATQAFVNGEMVYEGLITGMWL